MNHAVDSRLFQKSFSIPLNDALSSAVERTFVTCNAPNLPMDFRTGVSIGGVTSIRPMSSIVVWISNELHVIIVNRDMVWKLS